ncbi:uncharacterized protein N0V89_006730 [Didymosphaeria variabile]|uniref:Uncharacterized protein n=1 Tax=Didymosphaeria variabile TaxID=1932322 RepID=A0A9W8XHL9_9PLEO|nr:uncharacterized protein N0V89_006730 [Didymosphaeria variabile]KAJ4351388.1 hypothetical protein N0V89_006730 [Didymosphaeria variabile]
MSMDAGGLAQMTYNNFQSGGLGMPTGGFGSRGKGASLKRLSVASPPKVASIAENSAEVATPRTSRSHLLAGLRTAPKTPTSAQPPASAPYGQRQHNMGARQGYNGAQGMPQTAVGAGFTSAPQYNQQQQQHMMYDQVLAPPSLQFEDGEIDPNIAAQLLATEIYLAQRQQQLQQQLLNLTAQQFGNLNLGGGMRQQSFPNTPYTPYGQQSQNALIQETGQPGVYLVYNQLTGQYQYVVDPALQEMAELQAAGLSNSPPPPTPGYAPSPPKSNTPTVQVSPPHESNPSPWASRSSSPPKKSNTPPQNFDPLPPPSANAFRRGHKKTLSSLALDGKTDIEGPKSAFTRPVGFPATPNTGTFGPGQARAGEHPIRQPRGPPSIDELKEKPTTKHEGSKNFAARQRRQAVSNLVRAGVGRRTQRPDSAGSASPVSETEMSFQSSDNDTDSVRSAGSGSLSGKQSIGSLRAAANGAIGSERKASKERSRDRTGDRSYTANSISSDEGAGIGGGLVEIRAEEQRQRMPKLVLTSAEKRKSSMF